MGAEVGWRALLRCGHSQRSRRRRSRGRNVDHLPAGPTRVIGERCICKLSVPLLLERVRVMTRGFDSHVTRSALYMRMPCDLHGVDGRVRAWCRKCGSETNRHVFSDPSHLGLRQAVGSIDDTKTRGR